MQRIHQILVVKENHNVYYEDGCAISSSTAVLVSQHPWLLKDDHNHMYNDDPGGSSLALDQVLYVLQPTTWVATKDYNIPSDPG